jgi:hypothetical protein
LLAGLLSFDSFDPTVSQLLTPASGLRNALGLPGALIAGTLVEWLGSASLLGPALILNWTWVRAGRPRLVSYVFHGLVLLGLGSALWGLAQPADGMGLGSAGLIGRASAAWIRESTGPWTGAAILLAMVSYSGCRVVYAVDWARRGAEAMAFLRFGETQLTGRLESGSIWILSGFVRFSQGLESRLTGLAGGAASSLLGVGRAVVRAVASPARIRLPGRRGVALRVPPGGPPPIVRGSPAPGTQREFDAFDAWFSRAEDVAPSQPVRPDGAVAEPRVAETQTPQPLDQRFRAYSENLDLDWEERVLKANRARRALFDEDDHPQERKPKTG